jgi:hypothetical protein
LEGVLRAGDRVERFEGGEKAKRDKRYQRYAFNTIFIINTPI